MRKCSFSRVALLILCSNLLGMSFAFAKVTTRVDRPSVDLNESFLLEIIVDSNIDMEPDFSVLDEKFYRGQLRDQRSTSIINGQMRRSRTWSLPLMAKSTGTLEIPAIAIGNDKSRSITITVNEPKNAPPGEADVFVTSEVDQTESLVQAQILYRIKVYLAVTTRQPSLKEPTITGVEALVELAGDERRYEAILNGTAYSVVERVLAIYPQESGEISISPAVFEARVLRDGRITGRKVFESESHTIKVLPIPAPPVDYPNAIWLPARDLTVVEEWSREPNEIDAGEPVTRHITISALGQLDTQIPAFDPPDIDGMNVYADKPVLSKEIEIGGGIRGIRKDQYALIGVRGGLVEIPEMVVPWWDIAAGEWRVARLASRTIDIRESEVAVSPDTGLSPDASGPPDSTESAPNVSASAPVPPSIPDGFWKKASQLLAAVWVLTLLGWWWSSRDKQSEVRTPAPPPIYKQQSRFAKAARKASSQNDAAGVRAAVIEWARLQWPDDAPRSVGEVAERVAAPLSDELRILSAVSYGSHAIDWDGKGLAKALRSISVLSADVQHSDETLLPPLMPPGT